VEQKHLEQQGHSVNELSCCYEVESAPHC